MLSRLNIIYFSLIFALYGPVFISVFTTLLDVNIPSYSFVLIFLFIVNLLFFNNKFTWVAGKDNYKDLIFLYLVIIFLMLASTYGNSIEAKKLKLIYLVYSTLGPLIMIHLLLGKRVIAHFDMQHFTKLLSRFSKFLIICLLLFYLIGLRDHSFPQNRWTLLGAGNPIWYARLIGSLIIPIFIIGKSEGWLYNLPFVIIGLIMMSLTGSKGPLLSLLAVTLLYSYKVYDKTIFLLILSLICVIVYLLVSYDSSFFINSLERLIDFNNSSVLYRLEYINEVIGAGKLNYFGFGFGSFGLEVYGVDEILYPHNIFLEFYFETGLIGLFLLILLLFKFYRRFSTDILVLLTLFFFLNSLFSGNITSNNQFLIFLSLVFILNKKKK